MQLYNRRLHLCDSGAKEINRKQRGSAERQMSSSSSWNRKWSETEKLGETNTMGRGTSKRVTQTSQGRNKRRIDWPCQSEAVNERERRRRRGGVDSYRLGSREGSGERKWASIKLCQGQFAVNGPLHLVALSLRGRWLQCMLGGARPLKRQAPRQKHHRYNPYYSSLIIMQTPDGEGDTFRSPGEVLYKSTPPAQAFLPSPTLFCKRQQ